MTLRTLALLLPLLAMLATPGLAVAGTPEASALLGDYWSRFIEHWTKAFQKQNGIAMLAVVVGVVCLFIITRGKWQK